MKNERIMNYFAAIVYNFKVRYMHKNPPTNASFDVRTSKEMPIYAQVTTRPDNQYMVELFAGMTKTHIDTWADHDVAVAAGKIPAWASIKPLPENMRMLLDEVDWENAFCVTSEVYVLEANAVSYFHKRADEYMNAYHNALSVNG